MLVRLLGSTDPDAKAVRPAPVRELATTIEDARRGLRAMAAAEEVLRGVRRAEHRLRARHQRAPVLVDGHLRVLFPRDAKRRDQYRPKWPRCRKKDQTAQAA